MNYKFSNPYFEPHPNKDEIAFSYLAYDIAKYFFEVVRNILVVGAIKFFADKRWIVDVGGAACTTA